VTPVSHQKIESDSRSLSGRADDELISIKTVAWYLRVDETTVDGLTARGRLHSVQVSDRRKKVLVGDLRAYIAEQRVPRPSPNSALHEHARARRQAGER
jgi:hypothetical protein